MPAALMALLISAARVDCNLVCMVFADCNKIISLEVISNWMSSVSCNLLLLSAVLPMCVIAIWLVAISKEVEIPLMIPFCMVLLANTVLSLAPDSSRTTGIITGAFVGDFVGAFVGALVGAKVGAAVGVEVGAKVGAAVGVEVGAKVALVGAFVGVLVGAFVGAFVGFFVGFGGSHV